MLGHRYEPGHKITSYMTLFRKGRITVDSCVTYQTQTVLLRRPRRGWTRHVWLHRRDVI